MKSMMSAVLGLSLGLTPAIAVSPKPARAASGLEKSGRWLTYNGGHPYFVGIDTQQMVADPHIDYVSALNTFQANGINKLRIWLICPWTRGAYLFPWVYSGGKINLDSWDAAYWSRLQHFIAAAQSQDIIVEVSLFPANYIDDSINFQKHSVWNKANNSNNAFTPNSKGVFDPEFFDLNYAETSSSGKTLKQYQEALVDKAYAEIGGYGNVYFEICNEFPGSGFPMSAAAAWQNYFAGYLKSKGARLVNAHAHEWTGNQINGIQYFWDQPSIDILDFHFNHYDPNEISRLLHSAQTHGKVLQTNEGSLNRDYSNADLIGNAAWGYFVSGGYYAAYMDDPATIGSTDWTHIAVRLKVLRDIAQSVTFWIMSPVDDAGNEYDSLVAQGPAGSNHQVLAAPGNQYVVYFWGPPGTASVVIHLPAGSYDYKFYDVRDESIRGQGSVTSSGGDTTITSPVPSNWSGAAGLALTIRKQAVATPS